MCKFLVCTLLCVVGLCLLVTVPVLLPFLLLGLLFKGVFLLVLLPFRLLGMLVGLVVSLVALLLKLSMLVVFLALGGLLIAVLMIVI